MPQQLLCGVRAAGWQKVRLKFLYVLYKAAEEERSEGGCLESE